METATLEERVSQLERKMARVLVKTDETGESEPWWETHFGIFKNSPYFEEAERLGAEYRRMEPTATDEFEKKNGNLHS